jgi:hypothetical protein
MAVLARRWAAFTVPMIMAAALSSSCGDDGSVAIPSADDSPSATPESVDQSTTDADGSGTDPDEADATPNRDLAGTGTVTVGETTWEIEGTCNIPTDGIVLLTGTAVSDPAVEIYVTATPSVPDSASAYVTKAGEFEWTTGSFVTSEGLQAPETSYEAGTGRGSAGFIDQEQPPLDKVFADGTWEFHC